ncbi:MAG: hypothetical protein GXP27_11610 [Planctomycetes bacterium]|nr:hypothetical protein [Planctomycetota bacterium]
MSQEKEMSAEEAAQQFHAFVLDQMKAGASKARIVDRAVDMGLERDDAEEAVGTFYDSIMETAREQEMVSGDLLRGICGGVAAAVVGGVIWGVIVIATGYEVGYVAWALGLLAGVTVVLATRGKRGVPLQVVAIASSVMGILIGKYVIFYHFVKKAIEEEMGAAMARELSVFSVGLMSLFLESMGALLSGFDLLWVVLAVLTAWRIPKGLGIQLPAETAAV